MTVITRLTKTANYTLTSTTDQAISANAASGAFTLTLPTAVGNDGLLFSIKKTDSSANTVTVDAAGTEQIDGATTFVLTAQHQSIAIVSNGAGWEIR